MSDEKDNTQQPEIPDNRGFVDLAKKQRYLYLVEKLHRKEPLSKGEIAELKEYEAGPLPAGVVRTQEELARILQVSSRTIRYWSQDGMPKTPEGFYDINEIQSWREMKSQLAGKTESEREQYITAWYKNRAQLSDIAVRKAKGELMSRKDIEDIFRRKILAFARSYGALPREAAPAMEGMDVRQMVAYLTERINDIHNQFAEPIFEEEEENGESQEEGQDGLEPGGEGNPEAPAEDNSQPVE